MILPEPTYSFTIPSIHDDITLDCRLYHPSTVSESSSPASTVFAKKGALIAHPYAPLGGCYDDHVVGVLASELLKEGIIVGTFNFRGAGMSKGRTSWTGKPELEDYISFAGFFIHYLHLLHLPTSPDERPSTPPTLQARLESSDTLPYWVLLGGYSYGSLIVTHLPSTQDILQRFAASPEGTAAGEILLRARSLSTQSNQDRSSSSSVRSQQRNYGALNRHGHNHSLSVIMGGEETSPEKRRSSRELRRSSDGSHGSPLHRRIHSLSRRGVSPTQDPALAEPPARQVDIPIPHTSYLLVSPLAPPLSVLAAPLIGQKFWIKHETRSQNISIRPTLALFGDCDSFSSIKHLRSWAEKLQTKSDGRFQYKEITGAGHFWHEGGVEAKLRNALNRWVQADTVHKTPMERVNS